MLPRARRPTVTFTESNVMRETEEQATNVLVHWAQEMLFPPKNPTLDRQEYRDRIDAEEALRDSFQFELTSPLFAARSVTEWKPPRRRRCYPGKAYCIHNPACPR